MTQGMSFPDFSTATKECYNEASQMSKSSGQALGCSHFLVALLRYNDHSIYPLIERIGANPQDVFSQANKLMRKEPKLTPGNPITDGIQRTFMAAESVMGKSGDTKASLETMLASLTFSGDATASMLNKYGVTETKVIAAIQDLRSTSQSATVKDDVASSDHLSKYGQDLTAAARDGKIDPVIGRDQETRRVMQILSRRTKNNPVIVGSPGVGKAISDDTLVPVYDPEGKVFYKRHGDLQVGDFVFDRYGKPTQVIGVYPQGEQRVFKVHLKKRGYIECNDKHLWTYKFAKGNDPKYKWNTATLKEIVDKGIFAPQRRGRKPAPKYAIPMNGAVQWKEKDLPLDPYVLGAFIGNGYMRSNPLVLSSGKPDVPSGIAEVLDVESVKINGDNYYYHFLDQDGKKIKTSDIFVGSSSGLIDSYSHEKFVPKEYKYGSVEQRWSLIQGLFDTDGSINDDGKRFNITYSTVSKQLVEDIQDVLRGLGIDSSIREYSRGRKYVGGDESRIEYNLHVSVEDEKKPLFFRYSHHKLEVARKSVENTKTIQRQYNKVLIEDVIDTGEMKPMTCIMVDNEEQLYQVGKQHVVTHNTAIVEGLARRIVEGDCPEQLKGKTIYALDLAALSAGAKYQGEYEERVKGVLKDIVNDQGKIITFIDEIHMMVSGDSSNPMNLANMLKPMLARGEMHLIGATTLSEYRQFLETDPALDRRFQQVVAEEPSVEDAVGILRGIKEKYETHHGIKIQDSALIACAELSHRYISSRFLPDKAIDLMDESASRLTMLIDSRPEEIDEYEKKVRSLEIEEVALHKEDDVTDQVTSLRLNEVRNELADYREKLSSSKARWENQREGLENIREMKKKLAKLQAESDIAEREGNYSRVADIRYTQIPEIQQDIKNQEQQASSQGIDTRAISEEVTPDIVADVVSSVTGIPASRMNESETEKVLQLGDHLSQQVIGQPDAVKALAKAVKKSRAGVTDPTRPIGSFLFAGPSGVGKTQISKALAELLYDDSKALLSFSMEEYGDRSSVNKLIGSPAGYVGYGDTPALEAVRLRPSSVVLFDELEKADDQVIITLLSVLEEGRITLNNGVEVDFTNTIIIFTSNLGAEQETKEGMMEIIKSRLRPEFLNRLDEIIMFNPLEIPDLEKIVKIQVKNLEKTMEGKRITFDITPQATRRIATLGYDPAFGARPVRRIVSGDVSDLLADDIIHGKISPGDHVTIDVDDAERIVLRTGKSGDHREDSQQDSTVETDGQGDHDNDSDVSFADSLDEIFGI